MTVSYSVCNLQVTVLFPRTHVKGREKIYKHMCVWVCVCVCGSIIILISEVSTERSSSLVRVWSCLRTLEISVLNCLKVSNATSYWSKNYWNKSFRTFSPLVKKGAKTLVRMPFGRVTHSRTKWQSEDDKLQNDTQLHDVNRMTFRGITKSRKTLSRSNVSRITLWQMTQSRMTLSRMKVTE